MKANRSTETGIEQVRAALERGERTRNGGSARVAQYCIASMNARDE